jgi:hypothetical protein
MIAVFIITDQLRDYESNYQHMKNQQKTFGIFKLFLLEQTILCNDVTLDLDALFIRLKIIFE